MWCCCTGRRRARSENASVAPWRRRPRSLRERLPELRLHLVPWRGDDPTDHRAVFEFLRERMPELRRRFSDRELVIHISPGTPSMQTIWVLMAENGLHRSALHPCEVHTAGPSGEGGPQSCP